MHEKAIIVSMMSAIGANFVLNLDSIPDDKFDWKPVPTAKSALEIVNHLVENFHMFNSEFTGGSSLRAVTDAASAKSVLQSEIDTYIDNLQSATPEKLAENIVLPQTTMPLFLLAKIALMDTINHHGQITYIQTLLGDEESHFAPDFFQKLA
jgi:uncharacterized damage-inducible protein DinB